MNNVSGESIPLVERFPALGAIPRVKLVDAPTPVEPCEKLGKRIGYRDLWIKRDDLSAAPYGGNKPRKLEFSLAEASAKGAGAVVTVGGIGTNHGLATAIYARQLDLKCHLILSPQPVTEVVRKNLKLDHHFGATLHYEPNYLAVGQRAVRLLLLSKLGLAEDSCVFMGPGGTSALSSLGFVNAAFELKRQVEQGAMPTPAYVFCALGSCGTLAGLTAGFRICGLRAQLIGVRVVDRRFANPKRVARLANKTLALIRRYETRLAAAPFRPEQIYVSENYLGDGYGAITPQAEAAIALAAEHGITLETTYTAKTFAALCDFVKQLPQNAGPVVFWNTFNSRDLSQEASSVDHRELPPDFHRFFAEPSSE